MRLAYLAAALFPLAARAGWITFQNENKQKEGIPCVGSVYGNDNWLVSQFDCNAMDWNGTMCDMKCFPISSTMCLGFPRDVEREVYGVSTGIWYAPHGVDSACLYLGSVYGANYSERIGPNTTACGYIDWPETRGFGPVKRKDNGDQYTKGCWDTHNKPDPRYKQNSVHFYEGARPLNQEWCEKGYANECGEDTDMHCRPDNRYETQISCLPGLKKPLNPEIPRNKDKIPGLNKHA